jgi:glucose/arabinose dehydrogenase
MHDKKSRRMWTGPMQTANAKAHVRLDMVLWAIAVFAAIAFAPKQWSPCPLLPVEPAQAQAPTPDPDKLDKQGLAALLKRIQLPPGFHISLFASGLSHPREMCISPSGTVFVGSMEGTNGRIYALPDKNKDGVADQVLVVAKDLWLPNGVALKDGALYIAEINRITRLDDIENHLNQPPKLAVVLDDMSKKTHHGWKYIRFGPDGRLYVPQGSPCNVCQPEQPIFGTISSMKADGSDRQIIAKGIRNTVGFDWDPKTKKLWFTDNGRDLLGDDKPPDELNCIQQTGMHFGFPYRWGDNQKDPKFGDMAPAGLTMTPPAMCLGPHVASLGMRFYTGTNFPAQYRHNIFIAEHGSWNRSKKIGYRVTMVTLEGDKAVKYQPFATGWLNDATQEVSGRPVDIGITQDGAMLVSDDYAGNIYRISYGDK